MHPGRQGVGVETLPVLEECITEVLEECITEIKRRPSLFTLAAVLLWLFGTAAERAGTHRRLHPGNGKRRVDSRIFLARLLLVLDSTRDVLDELLTAIAPPDQRVASDHDGLLADGAAGG
ncbi:hypothetical protein CKO25_10625 [Thiocapsa imhoffii]|uniref:Uncharacterized protein n=1 Tax=Thiocapsa imhoffii TaxID=382777 RepID=A0A9X0WJ50_9GAMM|nr:hypothetical protein [Thiocapsa imhoffii]